MPPLRIGLTGGIGSGKSTVAALLAELGADVIDADAIARQVTAAGGAAIEALRQTFGPQVLDATGALDRARMRALAFGDPRIKAQLEAIVHPLVRAEMDRRLAASEADTVVLDLPLLAESPSWRPRCDRIWVVDCDPSTQVQRVQARSGWPREQVLAVIAQQASREQRLALADVVLDNGAGTDLATLRQQVLQAWQQRRMPLS